MLRFIKAQIASLVASLVDYGCTILCKEVFGFWVVWASGIGTVVGGLVNFNMGRRWVFSAREDRASRQMMRYAIVWMGYLMLTTLLVYLLTHYTTMNYIIGKVLVSLFMAFFYNYPLQKRFVFS
jgi:putative flippase GtrA